MNQQNIKLLPGLPADAEFYHKTGWLEHINDDVRIVDNVKNQGFSCSFPWPGKEIKQG